MANSDSLPTSIWSVEDYYRLKDFYEKRGLIFNPAIVKNSPAAHHVINQWQLRTQAESAPETVDKKVIEPQLDTVRDRIFISYSHKDKQFHDEFVIHLKPMVRNGSFSAWSDTQIKAGSKWHAEIENELAAAKVAFLLVTKDFLASEFIHHKELGPLLKNAQTGNVTILWVLVRACSYQESPIAHLQSAFSPTKPLAELGVKRDAAWVAICNEVKKAVNS